MAREFLGAVLAEARDRKLLSADHFTVDGTLLEAWASLKSFRPKGGDETTETGEKNPGVDFRGEHRTNATHGSTTDPEARLARKVSGKEARLCFAGHVLMGNRTGLVIDVTLPRQRGLRNGKLPWTCWSRCLEHTTSRWERTRTTTPTTLLRSAGR